MCLLDILLATRGESSTILLPGRWSSQREQISMRGIILISRELILLHHLSHSLSHPPFYPLRVSHLLVSLTTLLSLRTTRSHQLLILGGRSLLLVNLSLLVVFLILLLFQLFLLFLLLLLHLPSILKKTRTLFFLQQSSHHLQLILDATTHSFSCSLSSTCWKMHQEACTSWFASSTCSCSCPCP